MRSSQSFHICFHKIPLGKHIDLMHARKTLHFCIRNLQLQFIERIVKGSEKRLSAMIMHKLALWLLRESARQQEAQKRTNNLLQA